MTKHLTRDWFVETACAAFLAQLSGGSSFSLFRLPSYMLSESFHLIADTLGPFPASLDLVRRLYFS